MALNTVHRPPGKRWLRWLNIILVIYLLGGAAVYLLQERMIFRSEPIPADTPYNVSQPHRDIMVNLNAGYAMNVVQFTTPAASSKGVVLYLHGNMKNISWYASQSEIFTAKGYEVWMPDYPGFGKSTGDISEQVLYDYALQLYTMARSIYPPEQIVIYGRSLGTGIAAWLASKKSCSHLLLETPYYSMTSLASRYIPVYPASTLINYKIPTYKYLALVNAPVTVIHGTGDKVIPYSNASRLKEVLKPTDRFITVPDGGHNGLPQHAAYKQMLSEILGD